MDLLNPFDQIQFISIHYRALQQIAPRSLDTSRRPAKQRTKVTMRSSLDTGLQSAFNRG